MALVEGVCAPRFAPVQAALASRLGSGAELGASLVVDIDGECVVDVWGGHRDAARTRLWERDTISNVWSCSKAVTNLAALILVDRGELDVHAPVAAYWPQFAANGKSEIEVRHLLAHTSGVSGWEQPMTVADMEDVPTATARLATQAPWWEPGTASGYHASSQGHLVGEVVRRVSGRGLQEFVAQEIAGPLGADFRYGAPESEWGRIADVVPPPPLDIDLSALDPQSPAVKTLTGPATDAAEANTPAWRAAAMGAVNGHSHARGLNRILSCLSLGGSVDGVRLLSEKTIDLIFDEQADGIDLVLGVPLRWGIGYGLPSASVPYLVGDRLCFWGGWGGSLVVMDRDRRLTVTYTMNKMAPGIIGSDRSQAYLEAVEGSLAA